MVDIAKTLARIQAAVDTRFRSHFPLESWGKSHPGEVQATLDFLEAVLEERPGASRVEQLAVLAAGEAMCLRAIVLRRLGRQGFMTSSGKEPVEFGTLQKLDASLRQWLTLLGFKQSKGLPVNVNELWRGLADGEPVQADENTDTDTGQGPGSEGDSAPAKAPQGDKEGHTDDKGRTL